MTVVGISDGDTIRVRVGSVTERIRVIGINAPELATGDCFAQQSASKMQSLVQSTSVRLTADPTQADRDRYGRLLRHVFLADGRSVAGLLIAGGFGREYTYAGPYTGQLAYRQAEAKARAAGLGIWSSGCALPAPGPTTAAPVPRPAPAPVATRTIPQPAVPATHAPDPAPEPAASGSCDIKGNISSKGEKIYHVPGQRYYAQTKITEAKGERWFCSEQQALNAGWRKSKI